MKRYDRISPTPEAGSGQASTNGGSGRTRKAGGTRPIRLFAMTYCEGCGEAIPVRALACFKCGTKSSAGRKRIRVLFCSTCGKDFPRRALACFHCGHPNPNRPLVSGYEGS
ncbi:MAG: double zinc ribbon domain-containing protein [Planctomycetaceae bacterium]